MRRRTCTTPTVTTRRVTQPLLTPSQHLHIYPILLSQLLQSLFSDLQLSAKTSAGADVSPKHYPFLQCAFPFPLCQLVRSLLPGRGPEPEQLGGRSTQVLEVYRTPKMPFFLLFLTCICTLYTDFGSDFVYSLPYTYTLLYPSYTMPFLVQYPPYTIPSLYSTHIGSCTSQERLGK